MNGMSWARWRFYVLKCVPLVLVLSAMACGKAADNQAPHAESAIDDWNREETDSMDDDGSLSDDEAVEQAPVKRIRNAVIDLEVDDIEKAAVDVRGAVSKMNAAIDQEELTRNSWRWSYDMVIRVPAASLDALLDELKTLAKEVDRLHVASEDVTRAAMDIDIRLANLRATEKRYLELLDRADSVQDVLTVEAQVSDTRLRIEQLTAQQKALDRNVRFSTVRLTFYQQQNPQQESTSFVGEMGSAARWGVDLLQNLILAVIGGWPLWLIGGAITAMVLIRKKRREAKSPEKSG